MIHELARVGARRNLVDEKRQRWPIWVGMAIGAVVLFGAGAAAGIFIDRSLTRQARILPVRAERIAAGSQAGVVIVEVAADSPADAAGLEAGDEILAIDKQEVDTTAELVDAIGSHKPGDEVTLNVIRRGRDQAEQVRVTLGADSQDSDQAYLGVRIAEAKRPIAGEGLPLGRGGVILQGPDLGSILKDYDRLKDHLYFLPECPGTRDPSGDAHHHCGLVVAEVVDASPAAEAGLRVGDLILQLDGEPITSRSGFVDDVGSKKPGSVALLRVFRYSEAKTIDLTVRLGEHPDEPGRGYLGVTVPGFFNWIEPRLVQPYRQGPFWIPFERSR